jgi:hypothetical protein
MEPIGVTIGLVGMLGVTTIYFWIVRRPQQEAALQQ